MRPLFPSLSRVRTPEEIYARRYWMAFTVTLATMLELLDTSIVNVAIPHMMGSLGATLDEIAWVTTGYIVANVIVLPLSSWLSNYFGRRNYFAASVLIFTLASFFCGNADSLGELIFWRIIQGLGGGGLISTANAAIFEVFTPREAGTAGAIFGLGIMVGPMLGPTVGGWITDAYSWPWIFYINLPLGAVALVAALMVVPDSRYGKRAESVDWIGIVLLAAGVGCLQILLERGERLEWLDSWEIVGYMCVSLTALTAFVHQELKHPHPIVNLRILAEKQFAIALIYTLLLGASMYSTVFVFPVYLQTLLGYSAWETGIILLPAALASGLTMAVMSKVVNKTTLDLRWFMLIGASIFGLSMWEHGQFTVASGNADFFWPMIGRGVGLGMIFIPLNNLALGNLRPEQIANGSGLYNLTRQLGGSIGIAATATTLLTLQNINRGTLIEHTSVNSPETLARLATLKAHFMAHGASATQAAHQALTVLNDQVAAQASMIAFERLFLYFGIGMLSALPLLLLMTRTHFQRPTPADVH